MKKCDFSLDVKVVRELLGLLTICVGNEFQTDGAEYRKEQLASSVLIAGLSSSGTSDERRERADWHSLMCQLRYVSVEERWIL